MQSNNENEKKKKERKESEKNLMMGLRNSGNDRLCFVMKLPMSVPVSVIMPMPMPVAVMMRRTDEIHNLFSDYVNSHDGSGRSHARKDVLDMGRLKHWMPPPSVISIPNHLQPVQIKNESFSTTKKNSENRFFFPKKLIYERD